MSVDCITVWFCIHHILQSLIQKASKQSDKLHEKSNCTQHTHTINFHGHQLSVYNSNYTFNQHQQRHSFVVVVEPTHMFNYKPVYPYPNNVDFPPFYSIQCWSAYMENGITSYWSAHNLGLHRQFLQTQHSVDEPKNFSFILTPQYEMLSGRLILTGTKLLFWQSWKLNIDGWCRDHSYV